MDEPAADADHRAGGGDTDPLDEAEVPDGHPDRGHVGVVELSARLAEAPDLLVLPAVGLDDPHAGDRLLQRGQVLADPVPDPQVGDVRAPLEAHGRDDDHRQRYEADQRERHRHQEQQHEREHEQQRGRHELQEAELHQLAHRVDVGRQAGDEHAGLLPVVERHRLAQQVAERGHTQVAEEPLAGPVDGDLLSAADEVGRDRHEHVQTDGHVHGLDVERRRQAVVDGVADEGGAGQRTEGGGGDEEDGDDQIPSHRPGEDDRPAEDALRGGAIELVLGSDGAGGPHGQATAPTSAPTSSARSPSARASAPSPWVASSPSAASRSASVAAHAARTSP